MSVIREGRELERFLTHPLVRERYHQIQEALTRTPLGVENKHSHSYVQRRARLARVAAWIRRRGTWRDLRDEIITVPCDNQLLHVPENRVKIRTQYHADDMVWEIVGSRTFECATPSVPGKHAVVRYLSYTVSWRELDQYRC